VAVIRKESSATDALAVAHVSFNWGYLILMACLPQYFKHVLHFDVQSVRI